MYELISAFATQNFWCFWKPISPRILHPKSQKFHRLLRFTSSLSFTSKIVSSMMPSCAKSYVNEEKCKQWRQQRFAYRECYLYWYFWRTHLVSTNFVINELLKEKKKIRHWHRRCKRFERMKFRENEAWSERKTLRLCNDKINTVKFAREIVHVEQWKWPTVVKFL